MRSAPLIKKKLGLGTYYYLNQVAESTEIGFGECTARTMSLGRRLLPRAGVEFAIRGLVLH